PIEDLRETEVPQPLIAIPSPVTSSNDIHLTVGQAHTPATEDSESEPEEAPSETKEFKASEPSDTRDRTYGHAYSADLIPMHVSPIAEASALSPSSFHKRYRSSYDTSASSSPPALPSRKRYRAVDEPLGLGYGALRCRKLVVGEGEMPNTFEVGQSSRSMPEHEGAEMISAFRQPTLVTWLDPKDGRVYTDILTYVPPTAHVQTSPSPEWLSGSLLVSPSSLVVLTMVASPVTTPAATIPVDEDEFLEVMIEILGSCILGREAVRGEISLSVIGPVWGCDRLVSRAKVIENQVMATFVILISSDSSEDSPGTPPGRVILFGTIPTTIPDTTPMTTPPTADTPIITPTVPLSPDHTSASPDDSPASEAESDPSEDPTSGHIPPLPATSPFLSSDDDTTVSDTLDTQRGRGSDRYLCSSFL
nr:hypothetical protein [Tanacetum cinerariifolium]